MSGRSNSDGYFSHRALSSLRSVGSGEGDGWSNIREYWTALADGDVDDREAARWAQEIAKRVVRDVLSVDDAQERQRRALASLGLVGVEGAHAKEREYLKMYAEFAELVDEDKRHLRPTRRRITQQMLDGGYFKGLTEKQAMNAVANIQRALPRKK